MVLRTDEGYCFESTKTYTHSIGLSCAFRQWRAESHCRFIHGYALKVKIIFGCSALDQNNWCMDFGSLKLVRTWLENTFDHKLLVARDDPNLTQFVRLESSGVAKIILVDSVGIESFAKMTFDHIATLNLIKDVGRVWCESVEISEHEANSAIYRRQSLTHYRKDVT